MLWQEVKDPRGYLSTHTHVDRGGTGLEEEPAAVWLKPQVPDRVHPRAGSKASRLKLD